MSSASTSTPPGGDKTALAQLARTHLFIQTLSSQPELSHSPPRYKIEGLPGEPLCVQLQPAAAVGIYLVVRFPSSRGNQPRPAGRLRKGSGMDCGGEEQARQNGHAGDGADPAEWKKVAELRAVVEAQDPAAKEEDDFMLRRFLRARDHNINKASAMFLKYLSWKRGAKPRGSIAEAEVCGELVQDKLYVQGFDKTGRPMIYLFGNRHFAAKRDLEEFKRYVVYILDNTCTNWFLLVNRLSQKSAEQQQTCEQSSWCG